jgi:hypothetical protein
LSHPPEIGVIELSLAPIPSRERIKQDERSVQADPMALCGVGHDAEPFGREVLHGRIDSWRRHVASSDTAQPVRTTIRGLREVRLLKIDLRPSVSPWANDGYLSDRRMKP